ncbi:MAG: tetraacyldisaccharide 4'-kinase [Halopseudomonas sp.]|uniref:tetraacyldisaccharide 4'-kinase n=1 Tax=Halopseudomonas sp. TaxID=2901191 RepID=UPI003000FD18
MSLEQALLRAWYGKQPWLLILRPLSALYRWAVVRRRQRYLSGQSPQWRPPVPLIIVGNITLGGTGKTPMVLWLIEFLRDQGYRVGVISRGYGGQPPQLPWAVTPEADAADCGDEPLLIAQRAQVPLFIDPDRPAAARALLASNDIDVIISDDGLQHYALGRTVELVMLDAQRGLGNGRCLPEGPLREPPERLDCVDLVVCNGAAADQTNRFAMQLQPTSLVHLRSGKKVPLALWRGEREVIALAGIGNPQRFFHTLEACGFSSEPLVFADHASYTHDSLRNLPQNKTVIMTEKDAVKCRPLAQENWWYLSVDAHLSDAFAAALVALLPTASAGSNQSQE